ncbi:MAG TPA: hypothetical protein VGL62_02225 [Vicinamibacterales bacterium]
MILPAILFAHVLATSTAIVDYRDLPHEVLTATIYVWTGSAPGRVALSLAVHDNRTAALEFAPGRAAVVIFARANGDYLIDGPFVWPDHNSDRLPDPLWRRTLHGSTAPDLRTEPALDWRPRADGLSDPWPQCRWTSAAAWECWGTPAGSDALLIANRPGTVSWLEIRASIPGQWCTSEWGRFIDLIGPDGEQPVHAHVEIARAAAPPSYRSRSIRLESVSVPWIETREFPPSGVWIAGERPSGAAWAAFSADNAAPRYVALDDLASGAATVPEKIRFDAERPLDGTVLGAAQPASGAILTLFRLIDPLPSPEDPQKPRRVFAAETTAQEDGTFRFQSLGNGNYELVAWHPELGRASIFLQPAEQHVAVSLELAGMVRGRVLIGGKPAAGVDVFSVPDPAAYSNSDDPVTIKGGDGQTGADGRFTVSLAPSGGGELRVGGGAYSTRRVPLPSTPMPVVDLGDIELGAPLVISVVLDQDSACGVLATGPVGRLGLQIVRGVRTGPGLYRVTIAEEGEWEFGLDCAGTITPLSPSTMTVTQDLNGKEVRFEVRR